MQKSTPASRSSVAVVARNYETLVHDPRVLWPDTLSLAADAHLSFTANQLHRQAQFHEGKDLRQRPYGLCRVRVDARSVLLRRRTGSPSR